MKSSSFCSSRKFPCILLLASVSLLTQFSLPGLPLFSLSTQWPMIHDFQGVTSVISFGQSCHTNYMSTLLFLPWESTSALCTHHCRAYCTYLLPRLSPYRKRTLFLCVPANVFYTSCLIISSHQLLVKGKMKTSIHRVLCILLFNCNNTVEVVNISFLQVRYLRLKAVVWKLSES